jgi:hypothetical protein
VTHIGVASQNDRDLWVPHPKALGPREFTSTRDGLLIWNKLVLSVRVRSRAGSGSS